MYTNPEVAEYKRNGKCTECGRYSLLNQWITCKKCDIANKKRKITGYLRFPYKE